MASSFYLFCGVWSIVVLAIFIDAIRLSYRIEARSPDLRNTSGLPRRAMIVHTVSNWKVARDEETQAIRRRMNWRLTVVLCGLLLFFVAVQLIRQTTEG